MSKVHWQTIYCEKFTVDETGHFAWAMFGEDDTSIMPSIMFEKHTESSRNLVGHILQLCIPNKSDIFVLYVRLWTMKRQGNLYIIRNRHLGQVCVFLLTFPLLNNKGHRALLLFLCSNMREVYSQ